MYFEELPVRLMHGNALLEGKLELYEEVPDNSEQVLIKIHFNDQSISKGVATNEPSYRKKTRIIFIL
jgi:hypothetical protein